MEPSHLHPLRPTQAQLRWAQFHHPRVAAQVKVNVARMYRQPDGMDIPHALPSDWEGLEEEEGEDNARRPKISRGRQVLLRVSQRQYEERRQRIEKEGFSYGSANSNEGDDALDILFAESKVHHHRKRRRRNAQDVERIRRFEAAFCALVSSLAAAEHHEQKIVATRKWTRPEGLAVPVSVDGREYSDLKWGILGKSSSSDKTQASTVPFDRGASWMVHIPRGKATMTQGFSDSMRLHLQEVARQYLLDEDEKVAEDDDDDDDDIVSFVQQFERHVTTADAPRDVASFVASFEQRSNPHVHQIVSPASADWMSRLEDREEKDGFVQRLVSEIERAVAEQKPSELVSADGKLHKPTFALLIQRYLSSITRTTYAPNVTAPSNVRQSENTGTSHVLSEDYHIDENELVPTFVQNFMDNLENDDEVDSIITVDGKLNRPLFEKLVQHCLEGASNKSFQGDEASIDVDKAVSVSNVVRPVDPLDVVTPVRSTSDVFDRIRIVSAKVSRFRLGRDAPLDEARHMAPTAATKIVGSVSNKVGELFKSLHIKNTTDEEAYSAFREIQDHKRRVSGDPTEDGDVSSQSSFRVLPAGIRHAMRGIRGMTQMRSRGHEMSSEHKLEMEPYSDSEDYFEDVISKIEEPPDIEHLQSSLTIGLTAMPSGSMDTEGSAVSGEFPQADRMGMASLMLSPTLLTKRLQQAIRAVESFNWAQVKYLLSANPWLAEMADVTTNQYILHKLAYFGAGLLDVDGITGDVITLRRVPAPESLNVDLLNLFPSSVHKLDHNGNLPLHMAASSANLAMIELLGQRFSSGASVRNEDGMLPLHLVLIACASPVATSVVSDVDVFDIVQTVVKLFPGAIGVPDNEGNLPIHTAASVLHGPRGAEIVTLLMNEADNLVSGPSCLRFRNKVSFQQLDDETFETDTAASQSDSSVMGNESTNCLLVHNSMGHTPLLLAIYSRAGWEVIEALLGGLSEPMSLDFDDNNALHLLVSEYYMDPAAALVVLRAVPTAAVGRNSKGMLPIEIACMQMLPREVILGIVLVDLPINLDRADSAVRKGFGSSWWYLACECDDYYSSIVEEVVSFCSFPQVRSLSLFANDSHDVLLERATPKCKMILNRYLRFVGRFEFVDSTPIYSDGALGVDAFKAMDFGTQTEPYSEGRSVVLKCFTSEESFLFETSILTHIDLDFRYCAEIVTFSVGENDRNRGPLPNDGLQRFFVAIEQPSMTLSTIVRGMLRNHRCQTDAAVRRRYSEKVFNVLYMIAQSLKWLHRQGFIYGNLNLESCGKFEGKWKLVDLCRAQKIGKTIRTSILSISDPPELVNSFSQSGLEHQYSRKDNCVAHPSLDMWAFGKMSFEVLVGKPLIRLDSNDEFDEGSWEILRRWGDINLRDVHRQLEEVGVPESGSRFIIKCLSPNAPTRLDIDNLMQLSFWDEIGSKQA